MPTAAEENNPRAHAHDPEQQGQAATARAHAVNISSSTPSGRTMLA